mmetsp:Transcript_4633/g.7697  ORF Transcript_4633/g.7697 Transcript_4633/m.7697 type:complete len:157 (+) Transcript_4633:231-701(+)
MSVEGLYEDGGSGKAGHQGGGEEHNGQLRKIRREVRAWREKEEESIELLVAGLPKRLKRALEQVSKENVSFWLTASPLKQYGSDLYVGVFCDSLNLRHGQEGLRGLPSVCNDGCGALSFTLEYALNFKKGMDVKLGHGQMKSVSIPIERGFWSRGE